MAKDTTVWGIHAGKTGDADELFLKQGVVALGWAKVGDLAQLGSDKASFKSAIVDCYPDTKPGAVPVKAGQLHRFVHELQVGDLIAYPSKGDRKVHIGVIEGPYFHDGEHGSTYPQRRKVKWLTHVPRTRFSQGALFEIGSALSLFQIKNHTDEYRKAASVGGTPTVVEDTDQAVELVAEEIEDTTRDFILKRLAKELKGHPLAGFVGHLLQQMGYNCRVSPPGADGGIDIIAHRDRLGFEPPIIKVQVKSSEDAVGDPALSALYGKVEHGEFGLFVTLGSFSSAARNFARSKSNLRLIDGNGLVDLVLDHYERLDSRYKGLIPMKQVYIPIGLVDQENGVE